MTKLAAAQLLLEGRGAAGAQASFAGRCASLGGSPARRSSGASLVRMIIC